MIWYEAVAILLAGMAAGTVNAVVGSGTLITFPTLLAFGFPPVAANISNNIGLVPGGVSGTWGYRAELVGQGRRLRLLVPMSLLGSVVGAILLLRLPADAFEAVVPVLIAVALVLVLVQPRLQARMAQRRLDRGEAVDHVSRRHSATLMAGTLAAGTYGGYFGAAQGVLLVGLLGVLLPETLQRLNAAKNLLVLLVNVVAAVIFALFAFSQINWVVVALIAVGSLAGGALGARVGRRLPQPVLRAVIVVVGVVAILRMLTT